MARRPADHQAIRTGDGLPHLSAAPPESTERETGDPLNLVELIEAGNACLRHLDDYAASRAALVRHSLSLRSLPGRPWTGQFVHEYREGMLEMRFVGAAAPDGQAAEGVAVVRNSDPHAPFRDFRLVDAAGNPPRPG